MLSFDEVKKNARRQMENDKKRDQADSQAWESLKEQARTNLTKDPEDGYTNFNSWFSGISELSKRAEAYYSKGGYIAPSNEFDADIDRYLANAGAVKSYISANKGFFSNYDDVSKAYEDTVAYLSGLREGISKANDYFSKWKSEEDYNSTANAVKKRDELLKVDVDAYEKEFEDFDKFYNDAYTVSEWYDNVYKGDHPNYLTEEETAHNLAVYNRLQTEYGGDIDALNADYGKRSQYLEDAKQVQRESKKQAELDAKMAPYLANMQNSDFEEYAAKGAAIENPSFRDAQGWAYLAGWRPGAEDVGNIVTFSRDNWKEWEAYSEGGRYPTVGNPLYKHMTDDDVKLYNYLLAKEGEETANSYLSLLEPELKAKEGKRMADAVTGIDIPVLEDLMVVSSGLAGGVDQFIRGTKSYITGEESTPSIIQHTNENISESLDGIGYYAHQAAITVGNMAPSILLASVTGGLGAPAGVASAIGSASLGVSAAGNAYSDALSKGYDKGAARTYGNLVGASEATLQYLLGGVGKLGGASGKFASKIAAIDSGLLRAAARLGVSTGLEVVEEELQLYLEPLFRTIVFDEKYDIPTIEEMVETAIVTFMSTGALEGPSTISRTKAEQATKKQYGSSVDELIKEGLSSYIDSDSYKLATEYKAKIDSGKSLTGAEILQLVEANEKQFAVEDHEEAVTVAKERLKELGETGNINNIAEAVAKRATGEELTAKEKKLLVNSYGSKVAKEMTIGENETKFTPIENRIGKEGKFDVSEDGQTKIKSSGETLDLSNIEITNVKKGETTIKLEDGREVSADDIAFANDSQSYLVTAVSNIENVTPSAATAIVRDIVDPSKPLGDQMNGIDEAFTYGYHGYPVADLKSGQFTTDLTSEQMMSAYELGKSARANNVSEKDAPRVRMRTEAQAKLTSKQKAAKQNAKFDSAETDVYFLDGKNTRKFDGNAELDGKRMYAVNYAKLLSKMGIGGKYYFFSSYMKDGMRVYKDAYGNEVIAPNGIYESKDGSIYIDLNAGDQGQGVAAFTLGHELTHFIKNWSEAKFKVLSDILIEEYAKNEKSFRDRVNEKRAFLESVRPGKEISYDEAFEEAVADAMSTMLTDGNLHEKLAKIKATDKSLFNKIKQFFSNMIAKFQAVYKQLTPEQQTARDVRAMKDSFDKIQQAFAEALVEASDNFHSAMESVVESDAKPISTNEIITDGAVVADENGEKYSIRSMHHDIAEGKMFEDLKNVCGWTNAQVNTLRTQLKDLVEYMTPYRDILDMNETYGREGRRFSPYKPNSDPLYKISMDFSTLCSKRLLTQYVIENLQLRENRPMSAEEQMAIRDMLNEYRKVEKGLQVACAMCYVEAARLKSPKQIQRWLDDPTPHLTNYFAQKNTEFNDSVKKAQADFKESKGYDRNAPKKDMKPADVKELNKIGPRLRAKYQPSAEEQAIIDKAKTLPNSTYLTAGNLASLSETDPALYAAYTSFVRTATRSKSLETDEPYYYGDSSRDNGNGIIVSDSFIEAVNKENGMRFSSWSDWRIHHMLDYITAVIDNSVRGAAMHGYTKFGDEVRVLGKTGMMFNMSGVAGSQNGLNKDGSLDFSETESIDVNEAIQLREEFPETAGLQCIGVSPEHITALLRSDIIDYVIPYHVSGLNAALRRMADIHGWKDFTGTQHASIDKSIKFEDAVDKEHWHEEPTFSEFFVGYDTGMSGIDAMKESAERYKQMCKDRGLTPKFEQFASEENYWKLLIDRKMINQQTGNLIKQKAVTPTFDFDAIKGVVDKTVANYDAGMEQRALNHIVQNWDSIPQRIKDLKKHGGTKATKTKNAVNTLANQTLAAQQNDGTKFSLRESVEETKDLLAYHNITAKLLEDALSRNGLLMPSLAITNKGMTDFGEISLLFDKSSIDPSVDIKNKLYGADAWTPTQTNLKKNAKFDTNKTVNAVNSIKSHIGSEYVADLFNITAKQFRDTIVKADGSIYDAYAHDIGMQTAYAMEKGIISQIPTTKNGKVNRTALQAQLNSELDTDNGWRQYKRWLSNLSDTIITSYDKASNQDILNNMKKQPATAKTFKLSENGDLVVPAKEYASIDEARQNKNRLSENAVEETKAVANEFLALANKIGGNTKSVVNAINDTFANRYSTADIVKSFNSRGIKISNEVASELQALYKKAVELPTQYFEAKPGREVGFDEVKAVVIPAGTEYAELKGKLQEQGISVVEYDGSTESRVEALNSLDHLKFSERVSNKELAKMDDTALYINNTDKANYIGMIFSGAKTEETRSQRTLDAFIGNDFYVTDGKYVYGSIVLGEPHKYTAEAFHQKENQLKHRVPVGDKYDVNPGGTKWAYPIESYKKFAQPKKLSDSTEYKHSFQARQILYADKANLSKIEYDRLAKKKPIQVSKQELAMIRSQRKTKYGNLGEYDIPVIDFFRIGDYRIINNGFIYYIRNSGLDDFSVVMRKQIVPDVRRITREVIEDENRRNDAPTNPGTSQERGERRSDRSSGKRTRNGRELLENDGGTRQSGESQRILHSRKGDADSGALMSDRNLPSMEGYDGKTPTKRQLFDDISEIYFRMNALDRDLRKATKDGYAEGISSINGEIADVKERYIEYGEYLLENYEKYSLSDIRSLSRPLGLTEAFSDSSSYTVEQFRKDLAARVKEYRKDTKDAWSKQVKTMSREDKTLHTALKFMAYQAGYDVSGFDGVTEETEASHEDDWLLDSETPFSERGDGSSNRALLANAFEGITQNSDEYKMIQEYKNRIKLLNEQEEKLDKLNAEIRKIRFGTTGARDTARLAQLEAEAKNVAKAINRHDKKLLSLEASEPLRKVIERERKKEAQKTKDHVREVQQHKKLRAEQTELRHKIRKTIRDLDKILNRGNKKQNVKEDMKGFVSKALELADYIFTDHISNDDLIRKGITVRMRAGEAALVKETEEILYQLYDNADNLTDEEFARLDAKRQSNMEKLRDLLKEQRNERLNTPVYDLFDAVVTEYAKLKNSSQDAVRAAYNVDLERMLRQFIGDSADGTDTDRKTLLQNMRVADMTTDELQKLLDAYKMVLTNVRDANKVFAKSSSASIEEIANNITKDFSQRKAPSGKVAIVAKNIANKIGWDYEKLYYALDRIGSEAFTELVMNIANSENTVMQDIKESVAFRDEMVEKYGFNNWDVNKEIDREFLDNTGKKFKLTLGQVMALYAYSRRKGAWDHIEYGGFVFGEAALTNPKPADSYKLSKSQCEAITDLLTKEQKAYAEDMQKYLSDTMGAKGNEVSMMLYGIKMFGEKNYFPIKIAGQFKAQANESQAKAAAGFSSMTNAGFTHEQNPNAKAPFVLEGFNEIWSDHVNEMSRYHGTVPALEDMRRVMNRSSYSDSGTESMAIKQLMENSFGKEAVDYFDSLYREANSGAIQDKLQRVPKKLLSMFRKNSVAYSLSVVIQQPSAMTRAYAMIDPKYFGFKGVGALTSGIAKAVTSKWNPAYVNTYNKMLKYAPGVTMAKEIGGFDTHTGTSIREYLLDTNKSFKQKWKTGTLVEKGKAVMDIVDDNAIANLPNVADKIAWMEIWNACERETVAKHKELVPNSEEFLQFVGDRFTEVIRATQVYDSIFSKSPMLKSKNLAVQYIVSFMNEPNTTSNMVEKAVRDAIKGDWKGGVRTAAAVTCSIIFNNVLKSIVYAMRDDDEDETYIEKYIAAMTGGMIDDLNALNYVPLVRDVVSKLRGYDVERPDMAIITDAIDAFKAKAKLDGKDTDGMTEEEIAELDKQIAEANWDLVGSIASFFGIPAKNIIREIEGVIDHARIASANAGMTTAGSLLDKVKEEIIDSIPFLSSNETKTDKLYNAIISGDTAYLDRIKGGYKTEAAYKSAVRKALKENDPRIKEAAQARYDGRTEEYKMIFREIQKDGKFKFNDIMSAVNSAENDIKNGTEPETEKSYYSSSDFVEAIVLGDTKSAQAIKDDIIATNVANGKSQQTAEKEFISSVGTSIRDAYSSGLLDKAGAEKMLMEYADKDEEEAASKVNYWSFLEDHKQYKDVLSESNVNDYREFAEPAKISLDVFVQYINGTKGLETRYDEWGDVEVSKRDQVLEVIDSLPLTWQQKDALYLAAGYSESNIWDVPW